MGDLAADPDFLVHSDGDRRPNSDSDPDPDADADSRADDVPDAGTSAS
jgi:hypothetical protein